MGGGAIRNQAMPHEELSSFLEEIRATYQRLLAAFEKTGNNEPVQKCYPYWKMGFAAHLIGKKVWVRNTIMDDWHGPVTLMAIEESNVPYVVDRKRDCDLYANYRHLLECYPS